MLILTVIYDVYDNFKSLSFVARMSEQYTFTPYFRYYKQYFEQNLSISNIIIRYSILFERMF